LDAATASAEQRAKFEKRPSNNPQGVNGGGRKKGCLRTGAYLKQAAERNVRKKKMRWWILLLQKQHERQQESLVRGLHELYCTMEGLLRTRQRLDVERLDLERQLQRHRQEHPALGLRAERAPGAAPAPAVVMTVF
jgi:hypothetical protein